MYRIAFVLFFIMYVNGAPNPIEPHAEITDIKNENDGAGNYFFRFITSDGISREESGHLVDAGQSDEYMVVVGTYSYTDADGHFTEVKYKADKNGYSTEPPVKETKVPLGGGGFPILSLLGK